LISLAPPYYPENKTPFFLHPLLPLLLLQLLLLMLLN
jgi:hypothetical protein